MDYKDSGVDIDAGNEVVQRIRALARRTFTSGVLSEIGSFGGLFALSASGVREPVLVASADGVGTKLRVAFMTGNFPARHGIHGGIAGPAVNRQNGIPDFLDPRVTTIPKVLREGIACPHRL